MKEIRYKKQIKGITYDSATNRMERNADINVFLTKDKLGTTLSLSNDRIMITIPLEKVEILKVKEK